MKLREALADALVAEDVQLLFALMGDANRGRIGYCILLLHNISSPPIVA